MTLAENYHLTRDNFIKKAQTYFNFLVSEYGYDKPVYHFYSQPNGVVTADKFYYENKVRNRKITISNAYHPNDYGFEFTLKGADGEEKMLHQVLKENQNIEQAYLKSSATYIKNGYGKRL